MTEEQELKLVEEFYEDNCIALQATEEHYSMRGVNIYCDRPSFIVLDGCKAYASYRDYDGVIIWEKQGRKKD